MTKEFFILGLPRSRTAWLANFLTYDGFFCHHEALDGCLTEYEYVEKVRGSGDASTATMLVDLEAYFPHAPKLIIERDVERSIEYGIEVFGIDMSEYLYQLKERLDSVKGLRIHFDDIDEHLGVIWEYLTGTPCDMDRANMLKNMNVQVNDPFIYDGVAMKEFMASVQFPESL